MTAFLIFIIVTSVFIIGGRMIVFATNPDRPVKYPLFEFLSVMWWLTAIIWAAVLI